MEKPKTTAEDRLRKIIKEETSPMNTGTKPIIPAKINDDIVQIINARIGDEYSAHFLYNCASNWCNNAGYLKAGKFFQKESQSELDHAKKLQDFLVHWNLVPQIPQVETYHSFSSLVDVINQAYKIELDLYKKYDVDSRIVFQKDLPTFDFLSQFREIQRGSVAEFSDLLNGVALIDSNDKFQLLYFENEYFDINE